MHLNVKLAFKISNYMKKNRKSIDSIIFSRLHEIELSIIKPQTSKPNHIKPN